MGPHSFKCGKAIVRPEIEEMTSASMGPHSFKCGKNTWPNPTNAITALLQWGRTLSSAERIQGQLTELVGIVLQWGRTLSSAESPLRVWGLARQMQRFNGAALFQVRKELWHPLGRCRLRHASMGPHSFKCGKAGSTKYGQRANIGFNGAALFQVRKVRGGVDSRRDHRELQWGRTLSSAESSSPRPHIQLCGSASMGPHSFKCGKKK